MYACFVSCLHLYVFTCFSPGPAYKFLTLLLPSLNKVFTYLLTYILTSLSA